MPIRLPPTHWRAPENLGSGRLASEPRVTARHTVGDIVAALDLGVGDYLTKPFDMAEFMARLRAVARKGPSVQDVKPEVAEVVLDSASGQVRRSGVQLTLTRTQFALLKYFMRHACRVLTRESIIERIWGDNPDIEANALEVFIRSLRSKIDGDREVGSGTSMYVRLQTIATGWANRWIQVSG